MDAKVVKIEKSTTFGVTNATNEVRFIAVISFVKSSAGSKFACGAFGTNNTYKMSMDLMPIYGNDPDCKVEGKFSGDLAFKKLQDEYTPEGVNLFDIDLGGSYKVVASGNTMQTARIAIYGDEKAATEFAMRALERDVRAKRVKKVEESNEEEKEGE